MAEHSWFSPSAAKRIIKCPASVKLIEALNLPDVTNEYAERGTDCHVAMEAYDMGVPPVKDQFKEDWQYQAVMDALKQRDELFVKSVVDFYTERRITLSGFGHPDIFGTLDYMALTEDRKAFIVDYKFGAGIKVSPKKNPQLMIYALGMIHDKMLEGIDNFVLTIIQPRIYEHPLTWKVSKDELIKWFHDELEPAIEKAKAGEGFGPDEEACRWCPCNTPDKCEALKQSVLSMLDDIEKVTSKEAASKSDLDVIKMLLDKKALISQALKNVEAAAVDMMKSGVKIEGYKLVKKLGHTTWIDTKKADTFLKGKKLKQKERYKMVLISPSKAKKALSMAGQLTKSSVNRLNALTHRPDRGLVLVPEDDPRPEVKQEPVMDMLPDNDNLDEII